MNKIQLIGNLGSDPVLRTFPGGDKLINVSLATTERWRDRQSGQIREQTDWHALVIRGRLAETVAEICRKGTRIYVEGKSKTRKFTDDRGVERKATEVWVEDWEPQHGHVRSGGRSGPQDDQGATTPQDHQGAGHEAEQRGSEEDDDGDDGRPVRPIF